MLHSPCIPIFKNSHGPTTITIPKINKNLYRIGLQVWSKVSFESIIVRSHLSKGWVWPFPSHFLYPCFPSFLALVLSKNIVKKSNLIWTRPVFTNIFFLSCLGQGSLSLLYSLFFFFNIVFPILFPFCVGLPRYSQQ